jgi:hypothetical protein
MSKIVTAGRVLALTATLRHRATPSFARTRPPNAGTAPPSGGALTAAPRRTPSPASENLLSRSRHRSEPYASLLVCVRVLGAKSAEKCRE